MDSFGPKWMRKLPATSTTIDLGGYAYSLGSEVYHIMNLRELLPITNCGMDVYWPFAHRVIDKPKDRRVCKVCEQRGNN